jgi:hypothetical protein
VPLPEVPPSGASRSDSRAAGADDDDEAFLVYRALDEVVAALRCALGRYVAHGDDPAAGLRGYAHDEDLDKVVFRRKIAEEVRLPDRLAIR